MDCKTGVITTKIITFIEVIFSVFGSF